MKRFLLYCFFYAGILQGHAQFAPAAGQSGSTAVHKENAFFTGWATGCSVIRGLKNISDSSLGYASTGDSTMATGVAGSNGVVSLGDGGSAILTFAHPIVNGPGADFAVFENSFDDYFLELAFVEVSSDGTHYFRFHSTSLTDTSSQVGSFGLLDPAKINNLAGKYRALYGTPFDLEELKNETGLDVNNITHIRIVDVVGCLQNAYATKDAGGNKINDPWPTPFPSSGFDLDAVGMINSNINAIGEKNSSSFFTVYPNPLKQGETIELYTNTSFNKNLTVQFIDLSGHLLKEQKITSQKAGISTVNIPKGMYFLRITDDKKSRSGKIIITQ